MDHGLSSPFVFAAQAHRQPHIAPAAAFGAMSTTNALASASSMAIHIPNAAPPRKRKTLDDEAGDGDDHAMDSAGADERPQVSRKLSTPRSAIGNPALAQWVELDAHQNQSTLAALGLLPSPQQGNANLFAAPQHTPAPAGFDHIMSASGSTTAGTPAMTGSPSSLFSEIPGMPPTPSDSQSNLPGPASGLHRMSSSYFGSSAWTKQRTTSMSSQQSRPCGILEPQLGLSGADVAMNGSDGSRPSSHGPWCKSIPQLSVRADSTGSELWALCRDCGAFDKVNSSGVNKQQMAYSP